VRVYQFRHPGIFLEPRIYIFLKQIDEVTFELNKSVHSLDPFYETSRDTLHLSGRGTKSFSKIVSILTSSEDGVFHRL
jgi:hypothetical protein